MKKIITIVFVLLTGSLMALAGEAAPEEMHHEMQHGFIISETDAFFDHLVATGHHSHQLSFSGALSIDDPMEKNSYEARRRINSSERRTYFLFQAQKLHLPHTESGQILVGHIIESPIGDYTPKNVIVREAKVRVGEIFNSIINPFFKD